MTKKSILLIMIFLVCTFVISISFAFIIRETTTNNIISFGKLKMKMIVTSNENGNEKNVIDGETVNVTFDSFINRNIIIENICKHPMYVRVAFDLIGQTYENEEINDFSNIELEQIGEGWIYKNGWYYYKNEINKEEKTDKLIVNYNFNVHEIIDQYSNSTYKLKIRAEALQSENNNEDVLNAVGWPS